VARLNRSALSRYRGGEHAWWETSISDAQPGRIILRGRPVEELIGGISYAGIVGLLVTGRELSPSQAALLEAALVAGVDHGVRAPSIAAARMAATCGVTLNSAVATGMNLLGDHHGGAGERCMELLYRLVEEAGERGTSGATLDGLAEAAVGTMTGEGRNVPGFGHQLHRPDPRRAPLVLLVERAISEGEVSGAYLAAALAIERALSGAKSRELAMNVDGATAVIHCELGFPADAAKGLFCLSRGVGIVAHAVEERQSGSLIKGPCPPGPDLVRYTGPTP
jgi:citrate synthase